MNYFAHGCRFLADPWFLAGTAVPDWLNVVDRSVRIRSRRAVERLHDPDPRVAALARGIAQHHHDDGWFHATRAFAEISGLLTVAIRARLPLEHPAPAWFLGHIVTELLLDDALIRLDPPRLDRYYATLADLDPNAVEAAVADVAGKPVAGFARLFAAFGKWRFLSDYAEDGTLKDRLDDIMRRVGLIPLPAAVAEAFPAARQDIAARLGELLPFAANGLIAEGVSDVGLPEPGAPDVGLPV